MVTRSEINKSWNNLSNHTKLYYRDKFEGFKNEEQGMLRELKMKQNKAEIRALSTTDVMRNELSMGMFFNVSENVNIRALQVAISKLPCSKEFVFYDPINGSVITLTGKEIANDLWKYKAELPENEDNRGQTINNLIFNERTTAVKHTINSGYDASIKEWNSWLNRFVDVTGKIYDLANYVLIDKTVTNKLTQVLVSRFRGDYYSNTIPGIKYKSLKVI